MNQVGKKKAIENLQSLRNIGPVTAERLYAIGITTPEQLKKFAPEKLYERLKTKEKGTLDRCVLYKLKGAKLDLPWTLCKEQTKTIV